MVADKMSDIYYSTTDGSPICKDCIHKPANLFTHCALSTQTHSSSCYPTACINYERSNVNKCTCWRCLGLESDPYE
jgi:hypothetical protein